MSKRFISEADAEEKRRRLQEAWDATKGKDDPDEPPEQLPPDHRSLFHRLEEQRLKKQEDYEDAHKLKNMVRGLEDEEVQFLDLVDRSKLEHQRRVQSEDNSALEDYRKKVAEMQAARTAELVVNTAVAGLTGGGAGVAGASHKTVKKTSQKSLLAGAVKRKSESSEPSEQDTKRPSKIKNTSNDDTSPEKTNNKASVQQESTTKTTTPELPATSVTTTASSHVESTSSNTSNKSNSSTAATSPDKSNASTAATSPDKSNASTTATSPDKSNASTAATSPDKSSLPPEVFGCNGYLQLGGILPGLGQYSDSSDSESCDSDDSDDSVQQLERLLDITGRPITTVPTSFNILM